MTLPLAALLWALILTVVGGTVAGFIFLFVTDLIADVRARHRDLDELRALKRARRVTSGGNR